MTDHFNSPNDQGVVFPRLANGKRSTTACARQIVSNALRSADADLADQVLSERQWRKRYRGYFEAMTAHSITSARQSLGMAQSGLGSVYELFEFDRGGQTLSLAEAMSTLTTAHFRTGMIKGTGVVKTLAVPFKNKTLQNSDLKTQMADWVQRGIVEPGHAQSVLRVADDPASVARLPPIVMLGAGAEIAPYATLLELGATIIAVDLNRADIWTRLISVARHAAGTLIFPVSTEQTAQMDDAELAAVAGADLLTQTPEIATWLVELDRPLVLGSYAYLDGGSFMRVSVAMDAIMKTVAERSAHATHLAFLLTPTDVYAVPSEVADASAARFKRPGLLRALAALAHRITRSRLFAPNLRREVQDEQQQRFGIINNLLVQQGPNYTLAKRIQRWRSVVARTQGQIVSSNVAPATYTRSVTHNRVFAAGYAGAENFGTQIFEADTSKAVMTAQLIDDLVNEQSTSHPDTPLHNPETLFMFGANHSGLWRMAYQLGSVIEVAVLLGGIKRLFSGSARTSG